MSMELISREKAIDMVNEHEYSCYVDCIEVDDVLADVPTVKAIPIEKLEQILSEISEEIGTRQWEDYDYCSGLIRAKNIINKALKEVEQ